MFQTGHPRLLASLGLLAGWLAGWLGVWIGLMADERPGKEKQRLSGTGNETCEGRGKRLPVVSG